MEKRRQTASRRARQQRLSRNEGSASDAAQAGERWQGRDGVSGRIHVMGWLMEKIRGDVKGEGAGVVVRAVVTSPAIHEE